MTRILPRVGCHNFWTVKSYAKYDSSLESGKKALKHTKKTKQFGSEWFTPTPFSPTYRRSCGSEKPTQKCEKSAFLGQILANFDPFSKKIWRSIKTIKIQPWSKFWIIWTIFRDFMVIFLPFLAHFPLLLTIGKMGVFSHDFPRVSLNIS